MGIALEVIFIIALAIIVIGGTCLGLFVATMLVIEAFKKHEVPDETDL